MTNQRFFIIILGRTNFETQKDQISSGTTVATNQILHGMVNQSDVPVLIVHLSVLLDGDHKADGK